MNEIGAGLPPLSPPGPGQPLDAIAALSDEAKALVLAVLVDMRGAAMRGNGGKKPVLIDADNAIRRVARGLYFYELRRVDHVAHPQPDFDPTTGRGSL